MNSNNKHQSMARRLSVAALIATLLTCGVATASVSTVPSAEGPPRCCT